MLVASLRNAPFLLRQVGLPEITGRNFIPPFASEGITLLQKRCLLPVSSQKTSSEYFNWRQVRQHRGPFFSPYLLLMIALPLVKKEDDQNPSEYPIARINAILQKSFENRTVDEKIDLFNYLLFRGEEEAKKAKDKDVVIFFGNTGAGKSTLINYLYGCDMTVDDEGNMIVSPDSKIKEVAPIGTKTDSCTLYPKKVSDLFVTIQEEMPSEVSTPLIRQHSFTLYDMPGSSDTRGIEIALAHVVVMKQIIEVAKSVRFVMVFEHGQLNAARGAAWKETVQLLEERFQSTLGRGDRSLCLVMTKAKDDLGTIKKDIQKYAQSTSLDLSDYAFVYDPLDPASRNPFLETIFRAKTYGKLSTRVSMADDQLWKAAELGKEVQRGVEKHFRSREFQTAVRKVRFTHGIAKLGNEGLTEPHAKVSRAIYDHVESVINEIDPRKNRVLENQIEARKKYLSFKQYFAPFVSFENPDAEIRVMINETRDPRWVAWDKPETGLLSAAGTGACIAGAILFPPLGIPAAVGALVGASCSVKSFWSWWSPSKEEKDKSEFFNKKL